MPKKKTPAQSEPSEAPVERELVDLDALEPGARADVLGEIAEPKLLEIVIHGFADLSGTNAIILAHNDMREHKGPIAMVDGLNVARFIADDIWGPFDCFVEHMGARVRVCRGHK